MARRASLNKNVAGSISGLMSLRQRAFQYAYPSFEAVEGSLVATARQAPATSTSSTAGQHPSPWSSTDEHSLPSGLASTDACLGLRVSNSWPLDEPAVGVRRERTCYLAHLALASPLKC